MIYNNIIYPTDNYVSKINFYYQFYKKYIVSTGKVGDMLWKMY